MQSHRFFGEGIIAPQLRAGVTSLATGFMVCPIAIRTPCGEPDAFVQEIYQLAYQQAREAMLPPRHERSLLASWN